MKKFFEHYKQEDGAVAIIMAFIMVVLLGFTAFAVDQGLYFHKKQQLQTALDAAALAAVYKLPNQSEATATVQEYVVKNGFAATDVVVTFPADPKFITVTSAKQQKTYFANILGIEHMDYSCTVTAAANVIPAGGAFDYLLFSGSTTSLLEIKTNFNIYGSVHTNQNLYSSYNNGYIMGAAEAVGSVNLNSRVTVGQRIPGAPFVPMVDFTNVLTQVVPTTFTKVWANSELQALANQGCVTINGNQKVSGNISFPNGLIVNGKLISTGSITVAGQAAGATSNTSLLMDQNSLIYAMAGPVIIDKAFKGGGSIFASGNITFANGNVIVDSDKSISLYSANGGIQLNFGSTTGHGIIYAPKGNIAAGGGNTTWYGSIIGNTISAIPANITMYSNNNALPFIIGSRSAILVN